MNGELFDGSGAKGIACSEEWVALITLEVVRNLCERR